MELDELKASWASLDQRLGRLELERGRQQTAGIRAELRPLVRGQAIQILIGVAFAVAGGSFWVDHRAVASLLATGLVLHAYGIAAIVAAARNLYLVAQVRADAPVLELQRQVARLRAWRIREGRWFGIAGCFMWVPMIVWAFGTQGVDIVATQPAYVGLNLLAGVACLAVFLILARFGKVPEGASVRRARERLDELARFDAP